MFSAQILKRLLARCSQGYFRVVPLILFLMRTIAIIAESAITVMTKNSKAIGKFIIFQPSFYFRFFNDKKFSVFTAVTVGMVNRQKFKICFATTSAFWRAIAVIAQHLITKFFIIISSALPQYFFAFRTVSVNAISLFGTFFTNRKQRTGRVGDIFAKILRCFGKSSTTNATNFQRLMFNGFMSGAIRRFQHTLSTKTTQAVAFRTVFIKICSWFRISASRTKFLLYNYFSHSVHSFIVNGLVRLVRGVSDFVQAVFIISQDLVLPVDAEGKSVLFQEATINQTLVSAFCNKFNYLILSLTVRNSSAYLTTGFMFKLYNRDGKIQIRNALIPHQFQSALERVSALIL